MAHLLNSVLTVDPDSSVSLADVIAAVRQRIPQARRDPIIVGIVDAGHKLVCIGDATYVIGVKLV